MVSSGPERLISAQDRTLSGPTRVAVGGPESSIGFDERIPWPEGEDVDLARKVRETGRRLLVCEEAVVRHAHRDSVRGIFKDATLSGMGHRHRIAMGLAGKEARVRTALGMLRNHWLRALRAPAPVHERIAFAWFSLFKVAGYLNGARIFLRTKSAGQGRTLKHDLGAENLKGSGDPGCDPAAAKRIRNA